MTEYATLRFRAKRIDNATRWTPRPGGGSDFSEGHIAYNVPKLTSSHVITPRAEQGTRLILMFGGHADPGTLKRRTERLLQANGLDPYRIFAGDADALPDVVTIEPDRSGFMAVITLRLDLGAKRI